MRSDAFLGDAVIAMEGGPTTAAIVAMARERRKPVLPVGASGPTSSRLLEQARQDPSFFGGVTIPPDLLDALASPDADVVATAVGDILDRIFAHADAPPTFAPPFPRTDRVSAVSDRADADTVANTPDLLDISHDVDRLAWLMTAPDLTPPLAIGLFGEWGSGKSFFMGKLQHRVKALWASRHVGEADAPKVCQITFNAWHYADVELWAPLASTIFEELAATLGVSKDPDPVVRREALVQRLNYTQRQLDEAEETLADAQARHEQARVAWRHAQDAEDAIRARQRREVGDLAKRVAGRPEVQAAWEALQRAAASAGLPPVVSGVHLGDQLDAVEAHARSIWNFARSVPEWSARELTIALVILVAPLSAAALSLYAPDLTIPPLVTTFTDALAAGAFALYQVRNWLTRVDHVLTQAAQARQIVADSEAALREADAKAEEAALADAAAALKAATEALAARQAEVDAAQTALDDVTSGRALGRFVASRAADDTPYRQAEGVVSHLRRDLVELSKRLLDTDDNFSVRRVVLYVDDLDRCPPAQVVQVLQAVQLLLATDLFVVVVAVDPRWLERALVHELDVQLRPGAAGESDVHGGITAHDYLEKIFQIPFTLAPVGRAGFVKMLAEYLPPAVDPRAPLSAEEAAAQLAARPTIPGAIKDTPSLTGEPASTGSAVALAERASTQTEPKGTPSLTQDALEAAEAIGAAAAAPIDPVAIATDAIAHRTQDEASLTQRADPDAPTPAQTAALAARFELAPIEHDALVRLHGFIETPRALKRFVNVYRLLRASVPADAWAAFVDGEFHLVQALLAANVGCPRAGARLLRDLVRSEPERPLAELLDELEASPPDDPAEAHDRARMFTLLRGLHDLPETAGPLARHAARVGRYSFFWSWDLPGGPPTPARDGTRAV